MNTKFIDKLDKRGCKELCETMLRRAVKDRDRDFFIRGDYLLYQHLTDWKYNTEDYLRMIDELE